MCIRDSSFPPAFPALTCSAQSTYVTGLSPREHALPGHGWYNRNMCEIQFWKQSNKLVQGPRLWETMRERYGSGFTCAKLFWWYNMYSTADWTITPRPMYPEMCIRDRCITNPLAEETGKLSASTPSLCTEPTYFS